jgi:hypothetical protein
MSEGVVSRASSAKRVAPKSRNGGVVPRKARTSRTPQASPVHEEAPVFARHETFAVRSGWLKKGFDAASDDEAIFLDDDAPLRLGVGKNMVRAIRYWCHAFKV